MLDMVRRYTILRVPGALPDTLTKGQNMQIKEESGDAICLESMVDSYGLSAVLHALASICGAKADHLSSNWQDDNQARVWNSNSRIVAGAAAKVQS